MTFDKSLIYLLNDCRSDKKTCKIQHLRSKILQKHFLGQIKTGWNAAIFDI